jgi:hypothetical protein
VRVRLRDLEAAGANVAMVPALSDRQFARSKLLLGTKYLEPDGDSPRADFNGNGG